MEIKAVKEIIKGECEGCIFCNPDNDGYCSLNDNPHCIRLTDYCSDHGKIYKVKGENHEN